MFNITHTAKPGICKRRRCSRPAVENGLCARDLDEWRAAGSPPWSATGTPVNGISLVTAGTQTALAEKKIEAESFLGKVREFQITDQATMDVAGQLLDGVRAERTAIKAAMDKALAPVKTALEQQKALYQPVDRVYAETEALLRDKINHQIKMQQEAQDRARVQVEAAGGTVDEHTLVVAHGIENVALPVGMGVQESWRAEVTNEQALRRGVALTELVNALIEQIQAGALDQAAAMHLVTQVQISLGVGPVPAKLLAVVGKAQLDAYAREVQNTQEVPGLKISLQTTARAARRGR